MLTWHFRLFSYSRAKRLLHSSRPSVRLFSAPIPLKIFPLYFNIEYFYENRSRKKSKFALDRFKMSALLRGHQSTFYCCRPPHKALLCNTQYHHIVDRDVYLNNKHRTHCCFSIATMVRRTHHNVTLQHIAFLLQPWGTPWNNSDELLYSYACMNCFTVLF
jgi:hypothetical protein